MPRPLSAGLCSAPSQTKSPIFRWTDHSLYLGSTGRSWYCTVQSRAIKARKSLINQTQASLALNSLHLKPSISPLHQCRAFTQSSATHIKHQTSVRSRNDITPSFSPVVLEIFLRSSPNWGDAFKMFAEWREREPLDFIQEVSRLFAVN